MLSKLGLSMGSATLVCLLLELGLRATGYAPERYPGTGQVYGERNHALLDCYPTNPRGYFEIDLRDPKVLARYRGLGFQRVVSVAARAPHAVELRFNSHRFRDAEWTPKRTGVLRLVVLGDSFTEGAGLKEHDTYVWRLQALLDIAEPGRWEVRNCGRRGADFPELFRTFDEILELDPDVVLQGLVLNDAERTPAFQAHQRYLNDWILDRADMTGREAPHFSVFESRLTTFVRNRLEAFAVARESTRWYRDMYGEANREGWERTQGYFREMNRRMRSRGGVFAVAIWPLLVGLEDDYPFEDVHRALADFFRLTGISCHDLLPALQGHRSAELWVHPVDRHPNELATRLAAESLAPWVLDLERRIAPTAARR